MTARTRQAALCMEAAPAVDLGWALHWLATSSAAVERYRQQHGWSDVDPRGDALDADLSDAMATARSALSHHGIDADALGRAL